MAVINNLKVNTAMIENLAVEEGNIAAKAITNSAHITDTAFLVANGQYVTTAQITIASPSGNPVMLYYDISATHGGTGALASGWRLYRDGVIIRQGTGGATASGSELIMDAVSVGAHVYEAQTMVSGGNAGGGTASLIAQCNKK